MALRSIRCVLAVMLVALSVSLAWAQEAMDAAQQEEYQKLSGQWRLVMAIKDGKPVPNEELATTTLITRGNTFQFPQASTVGTAPAGTFSLNPSTDPKQVDSTATAGPNKGQVCKGIYRIEGDTQVAVFGAPGGERPTDFTAPAGSGRTLQVWTRVGGE